MKKKKIITYSAVAVATIGSMAMLGLTGLKGASAADSEEVRAMNPIQLIIERFNLDEDEVQTVIEEAQGQNREERLNQAVTDGLITEDQKALLLEKQEEQKAQREENMNSDLSQEERREVMEQHRAEMESWAEENDIPLELIMGGKGDGRGHQGMRGNGIKQGERGLNLNSDK